MHEINTLQSLQMYYIIVEKVSKIIAVVVLWSSGPAFSHYPSWETLWTLGVWGEEDTCKRGSRRLSTSFLAHFLAGTSELRKLDSLRVLVLSCRVIKRLRLFTNKYVVFANFMIMSKVVISKITWCQRCVRQWVFYLARLGGGGVAVQPLP